MKKGKSVLVSLIAAVIVLVGGYFGIDFSNVNQNENVNTGSLNNSEISNNNTTVEIEEVSLENIPEYVDSPYVVINNNVPAFKEGDYTEKSFETYSDLDALGRCGVAYANVGIDIMPTEDRGDISRIKPTGWKTAKYDIVDGKYLYNRCHLIGFQLTGENANKENLITGTRYFNVQGMLPFENMIADYVKETENHVLYRVTPFYEGDNLVANGVQMEAWSVEDEGEGVCFNVFVYNIQPGIRIDYATGESSLADTSANQGEVTYILNVSGKKFHLPDCASVETMKAENKEEYSSTREYLILQGYEPCSRCNP